MHQWNQFNFQDSNSPMMEEFIYFHDFVMLILVFVMSVVSVMILSLHFSSWVHKGLVEGQMLECIWTIAPAMFLILMAVPSLGVLYALDEAQVSSLTLKIIGHQWYWSYEFSEFWSGGKAFSFDSFMVPLSNSGESLLRLLDTDGCPALPFHTLVRALVTSTDVLHSWALPSLGVKMDAAPGRLNQISFISNRPGVAYGQCSEICGANHSFMPIVVEFVSTDDFLVWVSSSSN